MCLAALDWLDEVQVDHPGLAVEEYLTTDDSGRTYLGVLKDEYETSEGVSTTFGYLPIVFYQNSAFSGFDDEIADAILELMPSLGAADS